MQTKPVHFTLLLPCHRIVYRKVPSDILLHVRELNIFTDLITHIGLPNKLDSILMKYNKNYARLTTKSALFSQQRLL